MSGRFVVAGARSGFALGLAVGVAFATAAFVFSGRVAGPAVTSTAGPQRASTTAAPWHAGLAQGSLSDAVRQSARLLPGSGSAMSGPAAAQAQDGDVRELLARAEVHRASVSSRRRAACTPKWWLAAA